MAKANYTGHGWEGSKYDRQRSITDIAKLTKAALKKKYPACKFSITTESYSGGQSLNISLMSAPFNAIICNSYQEHRDGTRTFIETENKDNYAQLNQYRFHDKYDGFNGTPDGLNNGAVLTREAWDCMEYAGNLCTSYNYDDSDGMIDYFDTNFYLHLQIGKWDKPFQTT